tara:strand:+ start:122 stop:484 length:363 start_codon:yes stop_codon:yes gene_type:complete
MLLNFIIIHLSSVERIHYEIILITEKPQDAFRAYDLGFIDCIAPPFNMNRIKKSVKLVISKINSLPETNKDESHIIEIKYNSKTEKIPITRIKWIEAMGDYVKVITHEKNIWFYIACRLL